MNNPAAIISSVAAFIILFIFDPRKAKIYFITFPIGNAIGQKGAGCQQIRSTDDYRFKSCIVLQNAELLSSRKKSSLSKNPADQKTRVEAFTKELEGAYQMTRRFTVEIEYNKG